MRRLVPTLLCLAFAATLHASVPATATAAGLNPNPAQANLHLDGSRTRQMLPLTAVPADALSFYVEFYGTEQLPVKAPRKGGLLRWFTSAVKKTAQKVSLIPN